MRGPYLLRPSQVDLTVPCRVGGVYCLGKDARHVSYVGRAERNLCTTIKEHWQQYEFFWYEPTLSARECYINHCHYYHRHISNGGLDDVTHPTAPADAGVKCPVCGQ